jgi:hypothetical protein
MHHGAVSFALIIVPLTMALALALALTLPMTLALSLAPLLIVFLHHGVLRLVTVMLLSQLTLLLHLPGIPIP